MNKSRQERLASEFSVAVWLQGAKSSDACYARCIGKNDKIKTMENAAKVVLKLAIKNGFVKKGQSYEVDVSADASDDWFTVLKGEV